MSQHEDFYPVDQRVEVRTRFDQQWVRGFKVAEPLHGPETGYRLRRRSDGAVLPVVFRPDEVRAEPS
jgi:hypothetical protein